MNKTTNSNVASELIALALSLSDRPVVLRPCMCHISTEPSGATREEHVKKILSRHTWLIEDIVKQTNLSLENDSLLDRFLEYLRNKIKAYPILKIVWTMSSILEVEQHIIDYPARVGFLARIMYENMSWLRPLIEDDFASRTMAPTNANRTYTIDNRTYVKDNSKNLASDESRQRSQRSVNIVDNRTFSIPSASRSRSVGHLSVDGNPSCTYTINASGPVTDEWSEMSTSIGDPSGYLEQTTTDESANMSISVPQNMTEEDPNYTAFAQNMMANSSHLPNVPAVVKPGKFVLFFQLCSYF